MSKQARPNLQENLSPYIAFTREQWVHFRQDTPMTIIKNDLEKLHGKNEVISLKEIEEIYLPLSRLLNLYITAKQNLHHVTGEFLGSAEPRVPYIIGVAGSVAVGKSTASRVLQALLARWPNHPKVALVSTDGFLYSNAELEKKGIMKRKGFPESYNRSKLRQFLYDVKSAKAHLKAPVYSHHAYDILPNEFIEIEAPDIVLIEGLNILQSHSKYDKQQNSMGISDFFDFTIFVDAEIDSLREWYVNRLLYFYETSLQDKRAYFHYLSKMSRDELIAFGRNVWREINEINLEQNINPYKYRASLILWKDLDHTIQKIYLRKL